MWGFVCVHHLGSAVYTLFLLHSRIWTQFTNVKAQLTSFVYLLYYAIYSYMFIHSYVKKSLLYCALFLCVCVCVCVFSTLYMSQQTLFWNSSTQNFTPGPRHLYQSNKTKKTNVVSVGSECQVILHMTRGAAPEDLTSAVTSAFRLVSGTKTWPAKNQRASAPLGHT